MKIVILGAELFHEDGWTDGRTDRQTDRQICMKKFFEIFRRHLKINHGHILREILTHHPEIRYGKVH